MIICKQKHILEHYWLQLNNSCSNICKKKHKYGTQIFTVWEYPCLFANSFQEILSLVERNLCYYFLQAKSFFSSQGFPLKSALAWTSMSCFNKYFIAMMENNSMPFWYKSSLRFWPFKGHVLPLHLDLPHTFQPSWLKFEQGFLASKHKTLATIPLYVMYFQGRNGKSISHSWKAKMTHPKSCFEWQTRKSCELVSGPHTPACMPQITADPVVFSLAFLVEWMKGWWFIILPPALLLKNAAPGLGEEVRQSLTEVLFLIIHQQ